jgi:hypothetical protein
MRTVRFSYQKTIGSSNVSNHAQFFGAAAVNGNIGSATLGQVVNAAAPRVMQIAAKISLLKRGQFNRPADRR